MKGSWAVLVTAAALIGCRSSQPTPNPFLRTTVAPPATGQAVVVQGEPYYPGAAPQGVPPVTAGPAAPAVAAPPLGPPPAGPPVVTPPPPVIPQRDKYSPPGGSYQYHQSSNDHDGADDQDGAARPSKTQLAQGPGEVSIEEAAPEGLKLSGPSDAVEQAVRLNNEDDPVVAATYQEADRETRIAKALDEGGIGPRDEHPPTQVARASPRSLSAAAMNIVSPSADDAETEVTVNSTAAPETVASADEADVGADDPSVEAQNSIAAATTPSKADAPATSNDDAEPATVAAVARSAKATSGGGADYAFAPDYSSLSGRLEYSQTAHQWKLRYIPIDGQTDAYGGSVVLGGSPQLEAFKPGDKVAVRGSLAANSTSTASFSPLYRLDRIERLVH